jgi:hypothetical protein
MSRTESEFVELDGPGPKDILACIEWAPDPGSEATWRPVSDWAK